MFYSNNLKHRIVHLILPISTIQCYDAIGEISELKLLNLLGAKNLITLKFVQNLMKIETILLSETNIKAEELIYLVDKISLTELDLRRIV